MCFRRINSASSPSPDVQMCKSACLCCHYGKIRPNPSLSSPSPHLEVKTKKHIQCAFNPRVFLSLLSSSGFFGVSLMHRRRKREKNGRRAQNRQRCSVTDGQREQLENTDWRRISAGSEKPPGLKITTTRSQKHAHSDLPCSDWPVMPAGRTQSRIQTQDSEWIILVI